MVDVFGEVDELVRSNRLASVAKRWLPWVGAILLAALIVALCVWAFVKYQERNTEAASSAYADALNRISGHDLDGAYAEFGVAASKGSTIYKALSLMGQAGVRVDQNRIREAIPLLDEAAKVAPDPIIGDEARLKSALALLDTAPYAEVEGRLKPLTGSGRPYAALAREALAMAKLKAGKTRDALSDFQIVSLMADAPDDVRQRASAAVELIQGHGAAGLADAVKLAATLPPPAPQGQAQGAAPNAPASSDQTQ
ncbi:MAG TPA: tetratricopeptide repeat protein [Caulobacteraceae bacterium]|nr:tetratricopeptide repeat protein [Caulobacteraceae bacterium]